jgi:hypothetical protein
MIYLAWAGVYEGPSDRSYYDVLLPRIMEEITLAEAVQEVIIAPTPVVQLGKNGRAVDRVAREICDNKAQIHLCFIHADTGGRSQAQRLTERSSAYCQAAQKACAWDPVRCVILAPRRETEAWVLADPEAVVAALGYSGTPESINLPANGAAAEALSDPKAALDEVTTQVLGRRRGRSGSQLFTVIAQSQTLSALRQCPSFRTFESKLRLALASLGCVPSA